MARVKLEIQTVDGEQVPTIIAECMKCGNSIAVVERDYLLSRPLRCSRCNHERSLSYREYVVTCDSIAPQLLAHSAARLDKKIHRLH